MNVLCPAHTGLTRRSAVSVSVRSGSTQNIEKLFVRRSICTCRPVLVCSLREVSSCSCSCRFLIAFRTTALKHKRGRRLNRHCEHTYPLRRQTMSRFQPATATPHPRRHEHGCPPVPTPSLCNTTAHAESKQASRGGIRAPGTTRFDSRDGREIAAPPPFALFRPAPAPRLCFFSVVGGGAASTSSSIDAIAVSSGTTGSSSAV